VNIAEFIAIMLCWGPPCCDLGRRLGSYTAPEMERWMLERGWL